MAARVAAIHVFMSGRRHRLAAPGERLPRPGTIHAAIMRGRMRGLFHRILTDCVLLCS
jgi:hypothetical protein